MILTATKALLLEIRSGFTALFEKKDFYLNSAGNAMDNARSSLSLRMGGRSMAWWSFTVTIWPHSGHYCKGGHRQQLPQNPPQTPHDTTSATVSSDTHHYPYCHLLPPLSSTDYQKLCRTWYVDCGSRSERLLTPQVGAV